MQKHHFICTGKGPNAAHFVALGANLKPFWRNIIGARKIARFEVGRTYSL